MEVYYTGVIIAVSTFLIIGIFHPIVMKTEYYTGTRYWWVFLVAGIICIGAAFLGCQRALLCHTGRSRCFMPLEHR